MLKEKIRGTLLGVMHILGLVQKLIYISRMSDESVHIVFEKSSCKIL